MCPCALGHCSGVLLLLLDGHAMWSGKSLSLQVRLTIIILVHCNYGYITTTGLVCSTPAQGICSGSKGAGWHESGPGL